MAHLIFLILHVAAFLFGFFGLFITIPLHLIYCAINKKPMTGTTTIGWIFLFVIVGFMIKTGIS